MPDETGKVVKEYSRIKTDLERVMRELRAHGLALATLSGMLQQPGRGALIVNNDDSITIKRTNQTERYSFAELPNLIREFRELRSEKQTVEAKMRELGLTNLIK